MRLFVGASNLPLPAPPGPAGPSPNSELLPGPPGTRATPPGGFSDDPFGVFLVSLLTMMAML